MQSDAYSIVFAEAKYFKLFCAKYQFTAEPLSEQCIEVQGYGGNWSALWLDKSIDDTALYFNV